MATYRLKRKMYAFGFGSLAKAFRGMSYNSQQVTRLGKAAAKNTGIGAANKVGLDKMTAEQVQTAYKETQDVGKNLTKGVLGLGATAAVGAGAVGTYNTFTGQSGNDNF